MCSFTDISQWLADLGGVFYSVKEKNYSALVKRMMEHEFNREMEIEVQMAEDKEAEDQRIAKAVAISRTAVVRPATSALLKRVATQGVVKRPLTPRVGRGF